MQMLYAFFKRNGEEMAKAEKELFFSIDKAYTLYHYLLLLIVDVQSYAADRIEIARNKFHASPEERNPNTRFIDNRIINQIRNSRQLNAFLNSTPVSWVNYPELIKSIFNSLKSDERYNHYLNDPKCDYEDDKKIVVDIYAYIIANNEDLYQALEEQSIYWNDDVEFIISMIIKSVEQFKESDADNIKLARMYKCEEDREFVKDLFRKTIVNHELNQNLVAEYTRNWEIERIAFLDDLLMEMAVVEATEMPDVPTRVTLNEYIDIAKFYSTEKSSSFINGILDRIFHALKDSGRIVKKGKGLIGEQLN